MSRQTGPYTHCCITTSNLAGVLPTAAASPLSGLGFGILRSSGLIQRALPHIRTYTAPCPSEVFLSHPACHECVCPDDALPEQRVHGAGLQQQRQLHQLRGLHDAQLQQVRDVSTPFPHLPLQLPSSDRYTHYLSQLPSDTSPLTLSPACLRYLDIASPKAAGPAVSVAQGVDSPVFGAAQPVRPTYLSFLLPLSLPFPSCLSRLTPSYLFSPPSQLPPSRGSSSDPQHPMSADLEALNAVMGTFDSNRSADWFASNEGMQYQTHQPDQQPPSYMPHAYGSEAHMPPPMPPQQHRYTPLLKNITPNLAPPESLRGPLCLYHRVHVFNSPLYDGAPRPPMNGMHMPPPRPPMWMPPYMQQQQAHQGLAPKPQMVRLLPFFPLSPLLPFSLPFPLAHSPSPLLCRCLSLPARPLPPWPP